MSKPYMSRRIREQIVMLLVNSAAISEMKEHEDQAKLLFGTQPWGWIKQADTLIIKAMSTSLSPNIGQEESLLIHKLALSSRVVLQRKSEPVPVDFSSIPTDALYLLAEEAIGNRCMGCTITDYKTCSLHDALKATNMPKACNEKGKCPYLQ